MEVILNTIQTEKVDIGLRILEVSQIQTEKVNIGLRILEVSQIQTEKVDIGLRILEVNQTDRTEERKVGTERIRLQTISLI